MTLATPPFEKIFGVMSALSLGICVSNMKSIAVTVLELLAFNSHDRPLRTDRQTDTHRTNTLSPTIHFVHLAEIIKIKKNNLLDDGGSMGPMTSA